MTVYKIGEMSPDIEDIYRHDLTGEALEAAGEIVDLFQSQPTELPPNPALEPLQANRGRPSKHDEGKVFTEIYPLEDGSAYTTHTGFPAKQRTNVPVVLETALGTTTSGHNYRTMLNLMEEGFPVVMIGPEGSHSRLPRSPGEARDYIRKLSSICLRESSRNTHEILNRIELKDLFVPGLYVGAGESRGGGKALIDAALADTYDRDPLYVDAIAAPFPEPNPILLKANTTWENAGRLMEIGEQVASLGLHAGKIGVKRLIHYPSTLNLHPNFLAHVIMTIPSLVNGTTGKMAGLIPGETNMHLDHFVDDPWTDPDGWLNKLNEEDYPNTVHKIHPGDHGDILEPYIQDARLGRFRRLAHELEEGNDDPTAIEWNWVHRIGRTATAA